MKNPKIKPDIIFKEFWRQNDRFASLFNTIVFEGEEVIKPEELSELDTDVSNIIEFNEYKETLSRTRDVVKKRHMVLILSLWESNPSTKCIMGCRLE